MRVIGVIAIIVALIFIISPNSKVGRGISEGFRVAHEVWIFTARTAGWDIR